MATFRDQLHTVCFGGDDCLLAQTYGGLVVMHRGDAGVCDDTHSLGAAVRDLQHNVVEVVRALVYATPHG